MAIIDLTQAYQEQVPGFSTEVARRLDRDGWNATTLSIYSHAGTHMDAPKHFGLDERGIDSFPPNRFFGRAWLIDATSVGARGKIEPELVIPQLSDAFRRGDSLLIRTDWSKRIGTFAYRDELPRISAELARWCVAQEINMLGVEPPSVADVNHLPEVTHIHQLLLPSVIIIEGLVNLDQISTPSVELIALPLKIAGGDGAPARVMAIEQV